MRRAARIDAVQHEIVEGLRAHGYRVEIIGRPVDLLVGKLYNLSTIEFLGPCFYRWTPMEVKTPTKTGARRVRRDQGAQEAFIRETQCPVVTSLTSALKALETIL